MAGNIEKVSRLFDISRPICAKAMKTLRRSDFAFNRLKARTMQSSVLWDCRIAGPIAAAVCGRLPCFFTMLLQYNMRILTDIPVVYKINEKVPFVKRMTRICAVVFQWVLLEILS